MKKILLILFFLISVKGFTQNLPACDTLIINCCDLSLIGSDTVMLYANNPSSVLFDYPGFVILDSNMDTIAKETVNYFGIGQGFQTHYMSLYSPLILPFNGTLELHTGFFTALACSWPLHIADTTNGVEDVFMNSTIDIFPNPATNIVIVAVKNSTLNSRLSIFDLTGREIKTSNEVSEKVQIDVSDMQAGVYLLQLYDKNATVISATKLVVDHN